MTGKNVKMISCILISCLNCNTILTLNQEKFGIGFGHRIFSGLALKIRDCPEIFGTDGHLNCHEIACVCLVSSELSMSLDN